MVLWIHASSQKAIQDALRRFAFEQTGSGDHVIGKQWLTNFRAPWLLVLDNGDDPTFNLSDYIPHNERGFVLIASRNPDCEDLAIIGSEHLGPLEEKEACDRFFARLGSSRKWNNSARQDAIEVVRMLGYQALAVVHAASYLKKGLCDISDYPVMLGEARNRRGLLNYPLIQRSESYTSSTYDSLELSTHHLKSLSTQQAQDSLELLRILPFLHVVGISESIIATAVANITTHENYDVTQSCGASSDSSKRVPKPARSPGHTPALQWDRIRTREAFNLLASYSIVSKRRFDDSLRIHPHNRQYVDEGSHPRRTPRSSITVCLPHSLYEHLPQCRCCRT